MNPKNPWAPMGWALLLALATGCRTDAEEFAAEYPEALCTWAESCAFGDVGIATEACITEVAAGLETAAADPGCTYKPKQATQCLDALTGGCEERVAVYYECKRVYRGGECSVDLANSLSETE
jgi:hypothetical protein